MEKREDWDREEEREDWEREERETGEPSGCIIPGMFFLMKRMLRGRSPWLILSPSPWLSCTHRREVKTFREREKEREWWGGGEEGV